MLELLFCCSFLFFQIGKKKKKKKKLNKTRTCSHFYCTFIFFLLFFLHFFSYFFHIFYFIFIFIFFCHSATFEKHAKESKQVNVASFLMMCKDFGLFTARKDSNMNGRAGGGWTEPTIVDWISMNSEQDDDGGQVVFSDLNLDDHGNPIPPPVDPPVLSTRGYLPVTKEEIKKLFQRVSGAKNQYKSVKKVGFLWVLHEIIKLAWPRIHADQINFERELNSVTAIKAFRRTATKYVRNRYEREYRPQYNVLNSNGAIAYQLYYNRQEREFADDEFGRNYVIIAVVTKQWIPVSREEDQDGMYDFGEGYEPMELNIGMVMQLKEGMYNDGEFGGQLDDGFADDAYFSPLRRTISDDGETPLSGNEVENVDVSGVKCFYGSDSTTGGDMTGIFPSDCVRLTRVDYTFRTNFQRDDAAIRLQALARGVTFRRLRALRWKASQTIQKYTRGALQRVWWYRAILVRTSRAEYNVTTLLDSVTPEDRLATLLHRMGVESFQSAVVTTGTKSERGFRFAQGNASLPGANKDHRTTEAVPKWMMGGRDEKSRNPTPVVLPRRQVSNARAKKRWMGHNQMNPRSYQQPRPDDQGMLDEVVDEFADGLHMLYHAYSSTTGLRRTVHDARKIGTFEAIDRSKRTLGKKCSPTLDDIISRFD